MVSFLTILDFFKIFLLTYVISYVLLFVISSYDKVRRIATPLPKDLKK